MLRGKMVQTLVSPSPLLPVSTIPAAVDASPPQGPKRPVGLLILPLRMFPRRGSLGLAAWQQAAREPGGRLLLQCQCYFWGARLVGEKLFNSLLPRQREGTITPPPQADGLKRGIALGAFSAGVHYQREERSANPLVPANKLRKAACARRAPPTPGAQSSLRAPQRITLCRHHTGWP